MEEVGGARISTGKAGVAIGLEDQWTRLLLVQIMVNLEMERTFGWPTALENLKVLKNIPATRMSTHTPRGEKFSVDKDLTHLLQMPAINYLASEGKGLEQGF